MYAVLHADAPTKAPTQAHLHVDYLHHDDQHDNHDQVHVPTSRTKDLHVDVLLHHHAADLRSHAADAVPAGSDGPPAGFDGSPAGSDAVPTGSDADLPS